MANLDAFMGTYPYASELFGVYQPLLGWRSRQAKVRVAKDGLRVLEAVVKSAERDGRLHRYASYSIDDPDAIALDEPTSARLPAWMESTVAMDVRTKVNDIVAKHKRAPSRQEWQQIL